MSLIPHLESYKLIHSFSSDYCFVLDENNEVIWSNEAIRNDFSNFFYKNIFNETITFNKSEILSKDINNNLVNVFWKKSMFPDCKETFVHGLNITELWKREKNLQNHKNINDIIQNQFQFGIITLDKNGYLVECDKSIEKFFNSTESILKGMNFLTFIHPKDVNEFYLEFIESLEKNNKFSRDFRILNEKNEYIWFNFVIHKDNINEDKNNGYLCTLKNIHSFKLLENELITQSELYKNSLNSLNVGLWNYSFSNNLFSFDPIFKTLLDLKNQTEKINLKEFISYISNEDQLKFEEKIRNTFYSKNRFEIKLKSKNPFTSIEKMFLMTGLVINNDEKNVFSLSGVLLDITADWEIENKKIEEIQIKEKSSKLLAIIEMSSNIAHEINNPLAIVLGKAQYLKKIINLGKIDTKLLDDSLEIIEKNSKRIAEYVKELRKIKDN